MHTYTARCMETNVTTYSIYTYIRLAKFLLVNTKCNGARNYNQLQLKILAHAQEMPLHGCILCLIINFILIKEGELSYNN